MTPQSVYAKTWRVDCLVEKGVLALHMCLSRSMSGRGIGGLFELLC